MLIFLVMIEFEAVFVQGLKCSDGPDACRSWCRCFAAVSLCVVWMSTLSASMRSRKEGTICLSNLPGAIESCLLRLRFFSRSLGCSSEAAIWGI